jgi:hypothetical protein
VRRLLDAASVAILLPVEGDPVALVLCDSYEDESRLFIDLGARHDVLGDVAAALDALMLTLAERHEGAA